MSNSDDEDDDTTISDAASGDTTSEDDGGVSSGDEVASTLYTKITRVNGAPKRTRTAMTLPSSRPARRPVVVPHITPTQPEDDEVRELDEWELAAIQNAARQRAIDEAEIAAARVAADADAVRASDELLRAWVGDIDLVGTENPDLRDAVFGAAKAVFLEHERHPDDSPDMIADDLHDQFLALAVPLKSDSESESDGEEAPPVPPPRPDKNTLRLYLRPTVPPRHRRNTTAATLACMLVLS
jgi:hypothetical protein